MRYKYFDKENVFIRRKETCFGFFEVDNVGKNQQKQCWDDGDQQINSKSWENKFWRNQTYVRKIAMIVSYYVWIINLWRLTYRLT